MGHLINPVAFRLGWFTTWCDSWFSDHVYYPEFLHDIFRVRLFLNYFFTLVFFEKAALTFSHFELLHKYNFLVLRIFYYDGILMEGIFNFQADYHNTYLRRGFLRFKRRNRRLLGSRNGRLFLAIFNNYFRFSDFFKVKYVKGALSNKEDSLRIFNGRDPEVVKSLWIERQIYLRRKAKIKAKIKAKAMALAKAKGFAYIPPRRPRRHIFFSYNPLFKGTRLKYLRKWIKRGKKKQGLNLKGAKGKRSLSSTRGTHVLSRSVFAKFKDKKGMALGKKRSINLKQAATFSSVVERRKSTLLSSSQSTFGVPPITSRTFNFNKALKRRVLLVARRHRRKIYKLFKFTLQYCKLSKFSYYLKVLRAYFSLGIPLRAELKIFLIFLILFRRIWFLFRGSNTRGSKADMLREIYFTASFLFFYNGHSFKILSNILINFLKFAGLSYTSLKVGFFLISNDTVTAIFLSNFIGRKLVQGYRVRSVLSPIMHDLYKSSRQVSLPKVKMAVNLQKDFFSMPYRSGLIKSFILKFFYIYKRFYSKFFWLQCSWVNFFFFKFLCLFYIKFAGRCTTLLGISRKFMLQKHGFLFFFNYDRAWLHNSLSFVFNEVFFDFTNRAIGHSLFFFFILDDIYAHGLIIFYGQSWKKLAASPFYNASVFLFNRLVRYSYWTYSRNWLLGFNQLNKLKLRLRKITKDHGLLGFKVHLRGRFSRKQKASSLWYLRGQMPLNTSKATIDYAFRAYPLKNSLASVKVWLYKSALTPTWFIRQF